MSNLFIRDYLLTVNLEGRGIQIKPPMRIAFSCVEDIDRPANEMVVEIYGLSRENRISLTRDEDEKNYIGVELEVGYERNLATLFKGDLVKGSFDRSGADFITRLSLMDGGQALRWSYTSATVVGKESAIIQCIDDMENTQRGAITEQNELMRPRVLVGNSSKLIRGMIDRDQRFFLCKEQAHIIGKEEYRKTLAPVISAKTGLIGVPQSAKKDVIFTTMLNPMIELGGTIKLESMQNPKLNGLYKVNAIITTGESHGETWQQQVRCVKADEYKEIE